MSTSSDREDFPTRRKFLTGMTRGLLASAVIAGDAGAVTPTPAQATVPIEDEELKRSLKLAPLYASSEQAGGVPPLPYPPQHRVGIAVVGLGHLSLGQILPAFGASTRVRLARIGERRSGEGRGSRHSLWGTRKIRLQLSEL
jgi:hypothetical protein